MPSGDDSSSTLGAQPVQILISHLSSLYKKDTISKPQIFCGDSDINSHIEAVSTYLDAIQISDESSKNSILRETLNEKTRNQLIFKDEYEKNMNSFS